VSVTRETVERIARLARLALDTGELDRLTTQMNSVLEHVEELREVSLDGVEPFTIAAADVSPLGTDEPGADPLHLELAQNTPAWRDGYFTVPRLYAPRSDEEADA
jgi:aspartyl-tRNA(Asn)/glutamyl-tRNA(Gln) amidotransferase subunit C